MLLARGIGTGETLNLNWKPFFQGDSQAMETRRWLKRKFAELQNRAVGVERVQINAVHGRTDVAHFDGAEVFVAVERDV